MPPSVDPRFGNDTDYAIDAPMAFRRERNWFLSFVMTPFKDIDRRAVELTAPRPPRQRHGR